MRLEKWLLTISQDFEGPIALEKFPGGQSNPTYRLKTAHAEYVLRRKPLGELLPSAHAVEREFRLLTALHPTGYPVPRPIALCEDSRIIGSVFYVMHMVRGRAFWNGTLPEVPKHERRPIYEAMIDTLAALHKVDYDALGLADFGRPGNYFARQVARWTKQYRAAQTDDLPTVERLIDWLPQTLPAQHHTALIHGDFRIDNLLYAVGKPQVVGVLDWELATIGDPLADFAYLAMNWIMPNDGAAALAGIPLEEQGIPNLDEAASRYCETAGRKALPDLHWYFAYNLFRLVCILQGIKKRVAQGNASNPEAAAVVAKIAPFAATAWEEACRAGKP
jgi:aminoglycoside phosphotransferase (APT) family kinase protein